MEILDKIGGFFKGIFLKPDGSLNIIGIGGTLIAAAVGGFGVLESIGVAGGFGGAMMAGAIGAGIMGLVNLIMPSEENHQNQTGGQNGPARQREGGSGREQVREYDAADSGHGLPAEQRPAARSV